MRLPTLPLVFAAAAALALASVGCGYRVRVGAHDGGPAACATDADCALGSQCACSRCISLDVMPPACDPPCESARAGDSCSPGRVCARGACTRLECSGGTFVEVTMPGCAQDGGAWCECPPPPPGCRYDGSPCPCDHLTCEGGERCGRVTCGAGTVCCNASCNACAPPDLSCTAEACEPDCSPMDAYGDGLCDRTLGLWAWNGSACVGLSGCSGCIGSDCTHAFTSLADCESVFSACGATCTATAAGGSTCGPSEYCSFPDHDACGATGARGVCRARATICPPVISPVCGCDGVTYTSSCDAHGRGSDVAYEGPCDPSCAPQDARGEGLCDALVGWRWTGTSCEGLSGCSCRGADCGSLWRDAGECERAHAHCFVPFE